MNPDLYLGVETSGTCTGVALVQGEQVVFDKVETEQMRHDELLLPLMDEAFRAAGASPQDISGVGVTIGPGMFTSLRVGLGAAKGLALALKIPVRGINTLQALAWSVPAGDGFVLAVIDARKSQVYAALYRGEDMLVQPGLFTYAELAARLRSAAFVRAVAVGSGTALCVEPCRALGVELDDSGVVNPLPRVVALQAARAIGAGQADDLERLEPLYLRRTDAELARESRATST